MNNTRFATALHILTLLAYKEHEWLSSDWIAGSINVNPVIVRKELGVLMHAGLVKSRKGKEGGYSLDKNSVAITLADIYLTVKTTDVLGKKNLLPNPKCPVGKDINKKLEGLNSVIDQSVIKELQCKTLKNFAENFH
ncbi:Rrf2 family transcriptional regulator [uncultured Algoriphagus sp.]|uniref:Rrf2 family transcriptional regulator n=1 Tax=uncultured Algoriphagus sp. TaxID=417365 RepID=UPI0030EF8413|tara:strand:- start:3895 stop:4305 length:411 start_codon:yes stop_codon:yes gene_type:complete